MCFKTDCVNNGIRGGGFVPGSFLIRLNAALLLEFENNIHTLKK